MGKRASVLNYSLDLIYYSINNKNEYKTTLNDWSFGNDNEDENFF